MSTPSFKQLCAQDLGATVGPYRVYTSGASTAVHIKTITLQNYIGVTITASLWLADQGAAAANGNRRLLTEPIAPNQTIALSTWHYLGATSSIYAASSTVSCLSVAAYGMEVAP